MTTGWDIFSSISTAVGAAATVGAVIVALLLPKWQRHTDIQNRELEICQRQRALSQTLLTKVAKIKSDSNQEAQRLAGYLDSFIKSGEKDAMFQFFRPLSTHPREIAFDPLEINLLYSFNDPDVFTAVIAMVDCHHNARETAKLYVQKRRELLDTMDVDEFGQTRRAKRLISEIDNLLPAILNLAKDNELLSIEALNKLSAAVWSRYQVQLPLAPPLTPKQVDTALETRTPASR